MKIKSRILLALLVLASGLVATQIANAAPKTWDTPAQWSIFTDGHSSLKLSTETCRTDQGLKTAFELNSDHGWTVMVKRFPNMERLSNPVSFWIKAQAECDLEIKFVDSDGSVHLKKLPLKERYREWSRLVITRRDTQLAWKISKNENVPTAELQIGFAGQGSGTVWLDDLSFAPKSTASIVAAKTILRSPKTRMLQATEAGMVVQALPGPLQITSAQPSQASQLKMSDEAFLDMIERAAFSYFWNEADPRTGLVKDGSTKQFYSIAGTGFGLGAMIVGAERGYKPRAQVEQRVLNILQCLKRSPKKDGMFFHYLNGDGSPSGHGYENVTSTIDSALLLLGAIAAGEYFDGEIKSLADQLVADADWAAYVNQERRLIHMAWKPADPNRPTENGDFQPQCWDYYSDESILCSLLAIASPVEKHRLPPIYFYTWVRQQDRYVPNTPGYAPTKPFVYSWTGALFTYQFAHCWLDFKHLGPDNPPKFGLENVPAVDWFQNSREATKAARLFCIDRRQRFKSFGPDSWGLSACASRTGYYVGGFHPRGDQADTLNQGTIAPYASASSITLTPKLSLSALRHYYNLKDATGKRLVWRDPSDGGYGFQDSFDLDAGHVSPEILAIDQGPLLLAIENYRTGLLQKLVMKNMHIRKGLQRIGFQGK
jgi:hypothetical protein